MKRLVLGFLASAIFASPAFAQTTTAQTTTAVETGTTKKPPKYWIHKKLLGSFAEYSTFIGTGTFYTSGYSRPYIAGALYLRPSWDLGTKIDMKLRARVYLVGEFTRPDNDSGQRFAPLDTWIWLGAGNFFTEKHTKIKLSGTLLRLILPTSYESIYSNLALGMATGISLSRSFKMSQNWGWDLSAGTTFTKNFHTRVHRGQGPGEAGGCRAANTPALVGATGEGPTVGEGDHCGGALNTNFSFVTAFSSGISWRRLSLDLTLIFINSFKYSFPHDEFTSMYAVDTGRVDSTWGLLALGYDINDHLGLSLGLSSYQPALNSRYTSPRFPFFDFESGNAANYTQLFFSIKGTL